MQYKVEEVEGEKDRNIVIRLIGNDVSFVATRGGVDIYIDEKTADSIAFHIQSIIQDRDLREKIKKGLTI